MRLDSYLFKQGITQSRNKAQELIKSNQVLVNSKIISKTSFEVDETCNITILNAKQYVSRAGYKLKTYLSEQTVICPKDLICLDIGSSTGGFVQVLLEEGAKKVVAVDVGSEQLHKSLKNNKKLEFFENMDIRDFKYNQKFDIVTCDLSFIGVEHILNDIERFAKRYIIILFKPQFEVGNSVKRDKKGVVKDNFAIKKAKERFEALALQKWDLIDVKNSNLKGKEGNIETFFCFKKR